MQRAGGNPCICGLNRSPLSTGLLGNSAHLAQISRLAGSTTNFVKYCANSVRRRGPQFRSSCHRSYSANVIEPKSGGCRHQTRDRPVAATDCENSSCHPEGDLRSSWILLGEQPELSAAVAELPGLGS